MESSQINFGPILCDLGERACGHYEGAIKEHADTAKGLTEKQKKIDKLLSYLKKNKSSDKPLDLNPWKDLIGEMKQDPHFFRDHNKIPPIKDFDSLTRALADIDTLNRKENPSQEDKIELMNAILSIYQAVKEDPKIAHQDQLSNNKGAINL